MSLAVISKRVRDRSVGPEIPDADYDDPKELYAFFGLAAYCAGLLELSLVNLLATVRLADPSVVPALESDSIFDELHKRTFGALLLRAQRLGLLDADTRALLDNARERRNHLVHHYFRLHASTALRPDGVRQMIDELRDMAIVFRAADDVADPLWRRECATLGISQEDLDAELDRMVAEQQARDDV